MNNPVAIMDCPKCKKLYPTSVTHYCTATNRQEMIKIIVEKGK